MPPASGAKVKCGSANTRTGTLIRLFPPLASRPFVPVIAAVSVPEPGVRARTFTDKAALPPAARGAALHTGAALSFQAPAPAVTPVKAAMGGPPTNTLAGRAASGPLFPAENDHAAVSPANSTSGGPLPASVRSFSGTSATVTGITTVFVPFAAFVAVTVALPLATGVSQPLASTVTTPALLERYVVPV